MDHRRFTAGSINFHRSGVKLVNKADRFHQSYRAPYPNSNGLVTIVPPVCNLNCTPMYKCHLTKTSPLFFSESHKIRIFPGEIKVFPSQNPSSITILCTSNYLPIRNASQLPWKSHPSSSRTQSPPGFWREKLGPEILKLSRWETGLIWLFPESWG